MAIAPAAGAAALAAAALAAPRSPRLVLSTKLGGITGDGYGATAKLAEIAVCTTLVA